MRSHVNYAWPVAALILLGGCLTENGNTPPRPPALSGPAADYPVVIGEPFTVDGVTYTPADTLNYDAVGYAAVIQSSEAGIRGSHKTLPLPSYVEVTSLDSGKTALVRLESRGPMKNDILIELTSDAATQLGLAKNGRSPVRVRRVNPPETERAMLRSGTQAPERMETPRPLLDALMRKLAKKEPVNLSESPAKPSTASIKTQQTPTPTPDAQPATEPQKPTEAGSLVVQAAAFSTQERADRAAAKIGGSVKKGGTYYLLRLGPFSSRKEAEAGLAKAKAAGYGDALIRNVD